MSDKLTRVQRATHSHFLFGGILGSLWCFDVLDGYQCLGAFLSLFALGSLILIRDDRRARRIDKELNK